MMKSDKRHHRRKSQNQLQTKGTASNVMGLSSRVIGFPYEQSLKMPKRERNLIAKSNVLGAKQIVTTDCHKIERQSKEFSSKSNGNSTKNRIPRFNSERGVKEGYMVPNLWHKAEEKQVAQIDSKANTSFIKNSLQTKMFETSMMEKNFTPNIIEAHSVEKIQLKNQIQPQNIRAKVILTQQNQQQYQNDFKRQRSNFSTLGRTTEALSNNLPLNRADTSLIQEPSKQIQKLEQTTEIKNCDQPRYEQYNLIEKPNILTQPQLSQPQTKKQDEASEMLVLIKNTTKHLHSEAKRIVDNLNANQILAMSHVQQAQALFKDKQISRQSSPNLKNNVDINSPKSMKVSAQGDNFDYEVKIKSPKAKETDTSNYSRERTMKPHSKTSTDFHGRETKAPIQFKQKYPQTRIRADQPLHKSAQNHVQSADYNSNTVTNYKSSQKGFFQRQKPGSVMDEAVSPKKEQTLESNKPNDNVAATSAESVDIKQALQLPETTNTNEEKTTETSKLSTKKTFSISEQQQDVAKKMATTMPKIYKTPQVGLDTKYNKTSNLQRRLDAVKQDKIQQHKKNAQSNYKSAYRQQEGLQSPKNAHHRNSLTGPGKASTVYPVLANQGTSKFQMPVLSHHYSGSDNVGPSGSAAAASRQYSNHPVYTQAAPKFMPANSIKVHQAEAQVRTMSSSNNQKSDSIAYISSYRNLHQQQHQLMNYGSGTFGGGHTASSFNKRGRPTFKMGPNGKLILNRPKHCLADSTSQSSNNEESDNQEPQDSPSKKQENEGQSQDDQPQQQPAEQQQNASNQGQSLPPISNANSYQEQNQQQSQEEEGDAENAGGKTIDKKKKIKKVKGPKLIFNLYYTVYPLIKRVAKQNNFKVRTDDIQLVPPAPGTEEYFARQSGYMPQGPPPDFDVSWIDNSILPEVLSKVKPYQRISQFPGISVITNKKKLASGLMKMYKRFPDQFRFFPKTYILPQEYVEFKSQFEKYARILHGNSAKKASAFRGGSETYIIKPDNMCQGRGIYLVNDPTEVDPNGENVVAQKYITNPFLLDDLKFDIRLYVLLYGVNPLRIFLFKDGLVRLATEPYVQPTDDNIDNLFMHLTNYAINKNNEAFVQNSADESDQDWYDDGTHKRSFKSLIYTLKCMGKPYKKLKEDINDLLIKTLIVAQPSLQHLYKSCQPDDLENQLCFQILGFDVMIDEDCKPWLIEVNQSPSFKADSGLDKRIKEKLVSHTLNLLNLSVKRKQKWIIQNKKVMQQRMITGKKIKYTPEEKEAIIAEKQKERDEFEKANVGKFRLIYPCEDEPERMENYEKLLKGSQECWEQFTTGKRGRKPQFSGANGTMNNKESMRDMRADALGADGKPVWRGSGSVVNYMPTWEKNYQKSVQQKQARQASYQQQNSAELNMVYSARNQDLTQTRGSGNPFKSQTKGMKSKSNLNRGDKSPAKGAQQELPGKRGITLIQRDDSTCNIVGAESQLEHHENEIQRSPRTKKQSHSPSQKKQSLKETRQLEITAHVQDEPLPLSIDQLKTPQKAGQKMKSPRKRSRLSNVSQASSNELGQASPKGQGDDQGESPQV